MTKERQTQILEIGLNTAKSQMEKYPARPEYPRDYDRLYEWLEDKLFNLYEAIQLKKTEHIKIMAGEIIVTASQVAEFAEKQLIVDSLKYVE